jgi:hypothetical protein
MADKVNQQMAAAINIFFINILSIALFNKIVAKASGQVRIAENRLIPVVL